MINSSSSVVGQKQASQVSKIPCKVKGKAENWNVSCYNGILKCEIIKEYGNDGHSLRGRKRERAAEDVVMMQEASTENNYPGRILPFLALVFTLCTLIPLSSPKVWAEEIDTSQITMENIPPQLILLALADPPDFLVLTPTAK